MRKPAAYSFCFIRFTLFLEIFAPLYPSARAKSSLAFRLLYLGIPQRADFIALGNAKTSLFLAVLRKIILLIPLIYILPNFFADKAFAVFLAEPIADFLAVATTATMFFFQFRRAMAELEQP